MRNILAFILLISFRFSTFAGTLKGAWELQSENPTKGERAVMIATENYLSITIFEPETYIRTYGGTYKITDEGLMLTIEFNDKHPESVGTNIRYQYSRLENSFTIENQIKTTWKRIDTSPQTAQLAGQWRITSREKADGTMAEMPTGARKTLKICSGNRFQWFAINTETKEFFGTGGGTYTLIDGKYTETLEFFSRDNIRVGASLGFEAKVEPTKWQHTGKSSKGDRVNEVWTKQ